jgi:hypothetical protein
MRGKIKIIVLSVVIAAIYSVTLAQQVPVIVFQSTDTALTRGETYRLFAVAKVEDGGTLAYQWYVSTSMNVSDGKPILNSTDDYHMVTAIGPSIWTLYFYIVVTNTLDGKSASTTSNIVTIKANYGIVSAAIPIIMTQPPDILVEIGDDMLLSVSALAPDDGILSYQWFAKTDTGLTKLHEATEATFALGINKAGLYYYYVEITNTNTEANGRKEASVRSRIVTVTVVDKDIITVNDGRHMKGERISVDYVTLNDDSKEEAVNIVATKKFTAGPNLADKHASVMNFYRQGESIKSGQLTIYDAYGNFVNKLIINDKVRYNQLKRQIIVWDLTDYKGRRVSDGTYLVQGTFTTLNGKKERKKILVGVW